MATVTDSCTQMRRKLVTHGTLSLRTGERTNERQEWATEPCGAPLFTDAERTRRTCRSCASGWTHPNNQPVASASRPAPAAGTRK